MTVEVVLYTLPAHTYECMSLHAVHNKKKMHVRKRDVGEEALHRQSFKGELSLPHLGDKLKIGWLDQWERRSHLLK